MHLLEKNSLYWDALFEQMTEDISAYLWAVESWTNPHEDYSQVYLLVSALAYRNRGRRALELMSAGVPFDSQQYHTKLKALWDKSEKVLINLLREKREQVAEVINTELFHRLNELESVLDKVGRIAQDGDLFNDPDWVEDELDEAAKVFLTQFQEMALAAGELQNEPFTSSIDSKDLIQKFTEIEQQFLNSFGYFHSVKNFLSLIKNREYGLDRWWLKRTSEPDDVQEDEIPEGVMDSLKFTFGAERTETTKECPIVDKTTAYALGELDLEESSKIKDHIYTCRYCLDMFLDVSVAKSEAQGLEHKKVEILPGLQEALDSKSKSPFSFLNQIKGVISDLLTPLLAPKPVAVFVTACLVLFVSIYGLWDRPDMSSKTPVAIEITLLRRPYHEFGVGESYGAVTTGWFPEINLLGTGTNYKEIQLKPGESLKSGDFFRVQTKLDQDAFVYVIFCDSAVKISAFRHGYITSGKEFSIPDRNDWYKFDKNTGTKKIYLLATKNEIKSFDSKVQDLKKAGVNTISQLFPEATIQSFSFNHE